jgi:hypothetical protein
MKIFASITVLVLGWLAAGPGTASAAWNDVFQTCCNSCQPRTSYSAPAPSGCCPTICYQQRCCYQPYTAYRQESVMEPVTTYRTSYYWAPVTSYRYTSYYDPCTCTCRQVCTPCTSYQLRSQCNAVQSYVQRCHMVPYTAYRQSCYMEPVVTYSAPACPTCPTGAPPVAAPGVGEGPGIADPNRRQMPGISEGPEKNIPPQNLPANPNTRYRTVPPTNNGTLRTDRIASRTSGSLQGTIVADDRITPRGGARLIFTNLDKSKPQFSAQADPTGRFSVELPSGEWALYTMGTDGKSIYHSQITVKNDDQRLVTVVSR